MAIVEFQGIADHIVEVVVGQALALREAERMQEQQHPELFGLGEKRAQAVLRQLLAIDVGIDLDAPDAEIVMATHQLFHGEPRVLERNRSHRDEAP